MKKCTSLLLCLVLLLTLAIPAVAAESAHMEANAVADLEAATVTVVVSAKQSTANASLDIAFDPDFLTYEAIETGMAVASAKEADGTVTIGLANASAEAVKTGDTLVEVTFSINGHWDETALTVKLSGCNGAALTEELALSVQGSGYFFEDVQAHQWFYEAVDAMAEAGYIKGISASHFGPDLDITRASFVTLLGRMQGVEEYPTETRFTDVVVDSYYSAHVAWADLHGIVKGVGGNLFAPEENMLRYQMVLFLYRYANHLGLDTGADADVLAVYSDSVELQGETMEAFAWAVEQGIINGMNGKLLPEGTATRAQVAVMLYRFFLEKNA